MAEPQKKPGKDYDPALDISQGQLPQADGVSPTQFKYDPVLDISRYQLPNAKGGKPQGAPEFKYNPVLDISQGQMPKDKGPNTPEFKYDPTLDISKGGRPVSEGSIHQAIPNEPVNRNQGPVHTAFPNEIKQEEGLQMDPSVRSKPIRGATLSQDINKMAQDAAAFFAKGADKQGPSHDQRSQ